jgi:hypothetical protein
MSKNPLITSDPEILEWRKYAYQSGVADFVSKYLHQFDPYERKRRALAMFAWLEFEVFDADFLVTVNDMVKEAVQEQKNRKNQE